MVLSPSINRCEIAILKFTINCVFSCDVVSTEYRLMNLQIVLMMGRKI